MNLMRSSLIALLIVAAFFAVPASCWAGSSVDPFVERFDLPSAPEPVLKEVLSREEFRESPVQPIIDRIREWAADLLRRAFHWIFSRIPDLPRIESDADVLWMILAGLLIGTAALPLFFLVKFLIRLLLRKTWKKDRGGPESEEAGTARSGELRAEATAQAERGNYRRALILLFRFALAWLDEAGRLTVHHSRTNREILESVRSEEPLRESLGEMIPVFNRVRYGDGPCDKADYERFLTLCRRVTGRI